MTTIYLPPDPNAGRTKAAPVSDSLPFPTKIHNEMLPPVARHLVAVTRTVPGIGTGAAYADLDALGTLIEFPNLLLRQSNPVRYTGTLESAVYYDLDDEGLQVDLHLYSRAVTSGTDNSAYAPADADALAYLGTVNFVAFHDLNTSRVSAVEDIGLLLVGESTSVWGQAQARGALNIAAENLPRFKLVVELS